VSGEVVGGEGVAVFSVCAGVRGEKGKGGVRVCRCGVLKKGGLVGGGVGRVLVCSGSWKKGKVGNRWLSLSWVGGEWLRRDVIVWGGGGVGEKGFRFYPSFIWGGRGNGFLFSFTEEATHRRGRAERVKGPKRPANLLKKGREWPASEKRRKKSPSFRKKRISQGRNLVPSSEELSPLLKE